MKLTLLIDIENGVSHFFSKNQGILPKGLQIIIFAKKSCLDKRVIKFEDSKVPQSIVFIRALTDGNQAADKAIDYFIASKIFPNKKEFGKVVIVKGLDKGYDETLARLENQTINAELFNATNKTIADLKESIIQNHYCSISETVRNPNSHCEMIQGCQCYAKDLVHIVEHTHIPSIHSIPPTRQFNNKIFDFVNPTYFYSPSIMLGKKCLSNLL